MRAPRLLILGIALVLTLGVSPVTHHRGRPCAPTLAQCPVHGCEDPASPQGLRNRLKRRVPPAGPPTPINFSDLVDLQTQASRLVGEGVEVDAPERARLRQLETRTGHVYSEGDRVVLRGYVAAVRPNRSGESVNCRLTGLKDNDIHIVLVAVPGDTEYQGVVVELIPQARPAGWTVARLTRVQRSRWPVRVEGALFYDNPHRVRLNDAPATRSQPRRMSLWEIHPVTAFGVCPTKACPEDGWTPLERAAP